jgi:serine/threonine-protein kinase
MPLLVTCNACQHEFAVATHHAGVQVRCRHCNAPVMVPTPATPSAGTAAPDKLVGQVIGGCRLERRLGAGALGAVYEATQTSLNRRVAIKLLSSKAAQNETLVKRFRREARLAAQIQHANVVAVYDHGFDRGVHFLIMEFVDGGTLANRIEESGRLPWRQAAAVLVQVGQALALLKEHGIVHRDIKPANILVTADGVAKLADLGLARQEDPGEGEQSLLTMRGTMMGSPAYMAPEQARDAATASHPADVYSLGATFYHAVTGQPPFRGRNLMEIVQQVLDQPPTPPRELVPDLPQGIEDLILLLLEKAPEDRPQDPAEMVATATRAIDAPAERMRRRRAASAAAVRRGGGTRAPTQRWLVPAIIAAALVVVGLLVLVLSR